MTQSNRVQDTLRSDDTHLDDGTLVLSSHTEGADGPNSSAEVYEDIMRNNIQVRSRMSFSYLEIVFSIHTDGESIQNTNAQFDGFTYSPISDQTQDFDPRTVSS